MSHEHLLSGASVTAVTTSGGHRIFALSTDHGTAEVIDPLNGHYIIRVNGQEWQTTTPPPGLFGGA